MTATNFHQFYAIPGSKDLFEKTIGFHEFLTEAKRTKQYLYRRTVLNGSSARVIVWDKETQTEKEMIMFASNNYLDLAVNEQVKAASSKALNHYGYGSGSVALLSGTMDVHQKLEDKIAKYYGRDAAVVFPTGYSANVGIISALAREGDLILLDLYAHSSIVDGTKLSGVLTKYFRHNDMEHLESLLIKLRDKFNSVLIATDGVFSMDGDLCPLDKLIELKEKYGARLMIDEAHSVGVIGPNGKGIEDHFGLQGKVDILMGTLSKAPASIGGYATGSREVVEYIRHFANSYVFSTSIPPAVAAGLIEAFDIMETDNERRLKLIQNVEYFCRGLRELKFNIGATRTPIIPVIIGDELITNQMVRELHEAGIFASPVTYPAVAKTQSRIRISLMATHSKEDLDYTITKLSELGKKYGII
jgi:glycine C-acetyltransferase